MVDPETSQDLPEAGSWLDQHLRVYLGEETLWPVLLVVFAVAATFGAALLVAAFALGNLPALLAVVLLAGLSLGALRKELSARRLGPGLRAVLLLWAVSAVAAAGAVRFGWV